MKTTATLSALFLVLLAACSAPEEKISNNNEPAPAEENRTAVKEAPFPETDEPAPPPAKDLQEIREETPSFAMEAYRLRMQGKADESLGRLALTAMLKPDSAPDLFELSRHHYLKRRMSHALYNIREAVKLDSDNLRYLFWLGHVAHVQNLSQYHVNMSLDRKLTDESIAAYEKAIELDPNFYKAWLYLIDLLVRTPVDDGGDPEKANALADDLYKIDRGWGVLARSMAIRPGLPWDTLLPDLEDILEKDPDNRGALIFKVNDLFKKKDEIVEAEAVIDRIVKADPVKRDLYLEFGLRSFRYGHREVASRP